MLQTISILYLFLQFFQKNPKSNIHQSTSIQNFYVYNLQHTTPALCKPKLVLLVPVFDRQPLCPAECRPHIPGWPDPSRWKSGNPGCACPGCSCGRNWTIGNRMVSYEKRNQDFYFIFCSKVFKKTFFKKHWLKEKKLILNKFEFWKKKFWIKKFFTTHSK